MMPRRKRGWDLRQKQLIALCSDLTSNELYERYPGAELTLAEIMPDLELPHSSSSELGDLESTRAEIVEPLTNRAKTSEY